MECVIIALTLCRIISTLNTIVKKLICPFVWLLQRFKWVITASIVTCYGKKLTRCFHKSYTNKNLKEQKNKCKICIKNVNADVIFLSIPTRCIFLFFLGISFKFEKFFKWQYNFNVPIHSTQNIPEMRQKISFQWSYFDCIVQSELHSIYILKLLPKLFPFHNQ